MKKTFPTLYKYTSKGQIQQWTIIVEEDRFFTEEGIQGGKLTISLPSFCKPKNTGKSNETSAQEQALKEAQAKFQKKLDGGYNVVLTTEKKFFEPMLAKDIGDYEKLLFTVPTYIQPKMDGLRAISQHNTLMSRNGKEFVTCPHLNQNLYILDGELYNHKYRDNFNEIVSLCRKTKPTKEDLEMSSKEVEYWVYDMPCYPGVFIERYSKLTEFVRHNNNPMIKLVPTYEVKSLQDIEDHHLEFLEKGFEGSIIRLDLGPYENKRSKQLLKKKNWMDAEFKIIDAEEGEGSRVGTIGKFIVDLGNGNTCRSNIKGDFDYLRYIWTNKEKYIGKKCTIKFFGWTPDKSLRFPYVIKIDRDDYE
jgi:ATP-dependent DNA ligase